MQQILKYLIHDAHDLINVLRTDIACIVAPSMSCIKELKLDMKFMNCKIRTEGAFITQVPHMRELEMYYNLVTHLDMAASLNRR